MARDDKPTILVVEDNAALRRMIVRFLDGGGFAVLAAEGAAEGLSLARERQGLLDLAIVDLVMPGMSGLDLASELDREYPELKILYISGYVDSIAADVLSRRSPDHVLLKPFGEKALLDRVALLLGTAAQSQAADPAQAPASSAGKGTVG